MAEQRIANKRLDQDGGAFIDRRLAFNKNNLQILDNGWNNYVLTIDEFGITSLTDANLTSSFAVSASYADTASYAFFAVTASYAENFNPAATASYALSASQAVSSSYALSASFAVSSSRAISASFADSASQAISASFAISASRAISASYALSASQAISASYALSSSFATSSSVAISSSFAISASRAISASFADSASQAISASFAISASRAISSSYAISASQAISSSYAFQATSASFATSSSVAVSSSFAVSASFATSSSQAISASFAVSASRAISASFADSASQSISSSFAISASRAISASFATSASVAVSSSYAISSSQAISSSYALSASHAGTVDQGNIIVQDEGTSLGKFTALNFTGSGVTATDSGSGVANVYVPELNIYTTNGTLTGDRTVLAIDDILMFRLSGSSQFRVSDGAIGGANTYDFFISGGGIFTQNLLPPVSQTSIVGYNPATGQLTYFSASSITASSAVSASYAVSSSYATSASQAVSASYALNIYNSNGLLTGNRILDLNSYNLSFTSSIATVSPNTQPVLFLSSSGIVGMGTNTPASNLHVLGTGVGNSNVGITVTSQATENEVFLLLSEEGATSTQGTRITYDSDSNIAATYFNNIRTVGGNGTSFEFQSGNYGSGTQLVTFRRDGKVGIKYDTAYFNGVIPSASLYVSGNIHALVPQATQPNLLGYDTTSGLFYYFSTGSITASVAISASYALSASYAVSSSFASTASRAISASYVSGTIAAPGSTTQVIYNSGSILGADAGFVYSGSRVGIGITTPSYPLHVVSNASPVRAYVQNTAATGQAGIDFQSNTQQTRLITTNTVPFYIYDQTAAAERFTLTSAGNIGIGEASPGARLEVRGAGATSATTTFRLENSTPVSIMQVLDNGQFTYSGPLLSLASSQSAFIISQSISQSATVGAQAYGVNITPTFFATTASQTETAFRVNATFTGSAAAVSGSNIIADFGAVSAGSQLTVTDVTSGSIYMVNDVSGLPIIEATSDWTVNLYNYPNIIFQKTGSVINISGSLRVSGSSVFTGSMNVLGAVSASSFTGSLFGTASFAVSASYATTASHFLGTLSRIVTGSITASVDVGSNIFLIQSSSFTPFSVTNQGSTTVSSSAADMFLVRNSSNNIAFKVSQSGVVVLATQSVVLSDPAPAGGIYFTSGSFYVALD